MQGFYDISRPLEEGMSVYKERPFKKFLRRIDAAYPEQNVNESSVVQWNLHTGTHVDAPLHMLEQGVPLEALSLAPYMGVAQVVDLTDVEECIQAEDLRKLNLQEDRILIRTRNSYEEKYNPKFVYLSEEAGRYLQERGTRLVGIDAMSVERDQPNHPCHNVLLGGGVAILEDIRLAEVPEGTYILSALPLSMKKVEASPVRALLFPRDWTPNQDLLL